MRSKPIPAGTTFNLLTVVELAGYDSARRSNLYRCSCVCGGERVCMSVDLRLGRIYSCGCSNRCEGSKPKHGHAMGGNSPTYLAWNNMRRRCLDATNAKYAQYGERGIKVCDRWLHSFANFLADLGEKPTGLTLERKDVNGNYEPGNCEWATAKKQANNKTNNRLITYQGETLTMSQWADRLGIPFTALRMRLHRGWSIERALTP